MMERKVVPPNTSRNIERWLRESYISLEKYDSLIIMVMGLGYFAARQQFGHDTAESFLNGMIGLRFLITEKLDPSYVRGTDYPTPQYWEYLDSLRSQGQRLFLDQYPVNIPRDTRFR